MRTVIGTISKGWLKSEVTLRKYLKNRLAYVVLRE